MELADLTRGMRKTEFLEPENLIFAKPGLSEFYESSTEKKQFFRAWKIVFLQSHACMSFKRLVRKKQFFGAWKIVLLQSRASLSFMRAVQKNNFLEPEKLFFFAKQSKHARKKQFFGAWTIDFLQSLRFLQAIEENTVSGPQAYPHMDFGWNGSSPNMRAIFFFRSLKNCFSAKPNFIP